MYFARQKVDTNDLKIAAQNHNITAMVSVMTDMRIPLQNELVSSVSEKNSTVFIAHAASTMDHMHTNRNMTKNC